MHLSIRSLVFYERVINSIDLKKISHKFCNPFQKRSRTTITNYVYARICSEKRSSRFFKKFAILVSLNSNSSRTLSINETLKHLKFTIK